MSIMIRGRSITAPLAECVPMKGQLLIRLDDDDNPEFWIELSIPHADLLKLTAWVHTLTHFPDTSEELTEIDDVARSFGLHPIEPQQQGGDR